MPLAGRYLKTNRSNGRESSRRKDGLSYRVIRLRSWIVADQRSTFFCVQNNLITRSSATCRPLMRAENVRANQAVRPRPTGTTVLNTVVPASMHSIVPKASPQDLEPSSCQ